MPNTTPRRYNLSRSNSKIARPLYSRVGLIKAILALATIAAKRTLDAYIDI